MNSLTRRGARRARVRSISCPGARAGAARASRSRATPRCSSRSACGRSRCMVATAMPPFVAEARHGGSVRDAARAHDEEPQAVLPRVGAHHRADREGGEALRRSRAGSSRALSRRPRRLPRRGVALALERAHESFGLGLIRHRSRSTDATAVIAMQHGRRRDHPRRHDALHRRLPPGAAHAAERARRRSRAPTKTTCS